MNRLMARACTLAAILALAASATTATAQDDEESKGATLKPGDLAPALAVGKWVKGEPVKELEKGKVYVIECWATWCGPCVQAIPHVTQLQKKYEDKGLVVIGMNIWENDDADVEPFVKKMGDKMDYRVAMDDKADGGRGKMAETWMAAAGRNGIPCSFIVDREGRVAWIGHPMSMDEPLEQIIEGKFDIKKEADRANEEAAQQGAMEKLQRQFQAAMKAEDWDKALAMVDEAITTSPEQAAQLRPARVMLMMRKKDYKAANTAAREVMEGEGEEDQQSLVAVADVMLQPEDPTGVDLDLALSIAEQAAAMEGQLAWAGKMLAGKAHAAKGDYAKAIELHTAAMQAAPEQTKARFEADLKKYKEKAAAAGKSKGASKEGEAEGESDAAEEPKDEGAKSEGTGKE